MARRRKPIFRLPERGYFVLAQFGWESARTCCRCGAADRGGGRGRPPALACWRAQVYDWNSQQLSLFNEVAKPIVHSCLEGYNGACDWSYITPPLGLRSANRHLIVHKPALS